MGYEYLDGDASERIEMPGGVIGYRNSYDMVEDAAPPRAGGREAQGAVGQARQVRPRARPVSTCG
jgi:hypothetical protein